ncbi:MAG TPA: hypothetical protein VID26_09610 [Candidatus Limnocylindrales bacterium]|jgi:hypothetical protein
MPVTYTATDLANEFAGLAAKIAQRTNAVALGVRDRTLPHESAVLALKSARADFDAVELTTRNKATDLLMSELTATRTAIGRVRSSIKSAAEESRRVADALEFQSLIGQATGKSPKEVGELGKQFMADSARLYAEGDTNGAMVAAKAAERFGTNGATKWRETLQLDLDTSDPEMKALITRREQAIQDAYALAQSIRVAKAETLKGIETAAKAGGIGNELPAVAMNAAKERAAISIRAKTDELMTSVEAGTPYLGVVEKSLPKNDLPDRMDSDTRMLPPVDATTTIR